MMGRQSKVQSKLFYTAVNLEKRIRKDHLLRAGDKLVDFDFIYKQVGDRYGIKGNVSVPPPVILKMMLLLILYNVRSERELVDTIPERLDWLWFLGYDLDDEIPNHSVLSKARTRWGVEAFKTFFDNIVIQCVEAGLVDGSKLFTDASLMDANASNNSVLNRHSLKRYLNKSYRRLEQRLERADAPAPRESDKSGEANRKYVSTTDPDASVVRMGAGRSKLRYKIHRGVDENAEVITATEVTPGEANEANLLMSLVDTHERNTGETVKVAVGDSKYGTIENYLASCERGIDPHFESFDKAHRGTGRRRDIFEPADFVYNPDEDLFICPAGELLLPRKFKKKRNHIEYAAGAKTCNRCTLKAQCTRSSMGRTLKRHLRQEDLEQMRALSETPLAKRDIRKRQHLMERSYAQGSRYGFDKARWRGLWRVQIQEYLVAAVQNINILVRNFKEQRKVAAMRDAAGTPRLIHIIKLLYIWVQAPNPA
jgi:transposase